MDTKFINKFKQRLEDLEHASENSSNFWIAKAYNELYAKSEREIVKNSTL